MSKKTLQQPKKTRKYVPKRVLTSDEEESKKELEIASAIEAVSVSEGGIIIQDNLIRDIISLVSALAVKYKSATHIELITHCADLKTKLDLLRILSRAGKNKDFLLEQLADALKE